MSILSFIGLENYIDNMLFDYFYPNIQIILLKSNDKKNINSHIAEFDNECMRIIWGSK